jgi:hypothetical protein
MRPQLQRCISQGLPRPIYHVWAKKELGHTSTNMKRRMTTAVYSEGEDIEHISKELARLIHRTERNWALSENGKGLERSFKFKSFKTTWVSKYSTVSETCSNQLKRLLGLYECNCKAMRRPTSPSRVVQRK